MASIDEKFKLKYNGVCWYNGSLDTGLMDTPTHTKNPPYANYNNTIAGYKQVYMPVKYSKYQPNSQNYTQYLDTKPDATYAYSTWFKTGYNSNYKLDLELTYTDTTTVYDWSTHTYVKMIRTPFYYELDLVTPYIWEYPQDPWDDFVDAYDTYMSSHSVVTWSNGGGDNTGQLRSLGMWYNEKEYPSNPDKTLTDKVIIQCELYTHNIIAEDPVEKYWEENSKIHVTFAFNGLWGTPDLDDYFTLKKGIAPTPFPDPYNGQLPGAGSTRLSYGVQQFSKVNKSNY